MVLEIVGIQFSSQSWFLCVALRRFITNSMSQTRAGTEPEPCGGPATLFFTDDIDAPTIVSNHVAARRRARPAAKSP
jgi:hypothetical protein